jgi:hypothetical protein
MLNVYIMGPYTAPTAEEVEINVLNAQIIAAAILKAGGHPRCPHVMSHRIATLFPEPVWIREGLYTMTQCEAGIRLPMCPAVERSKGTRHEWRFGHDIGLAMFEALAISPDPEIALPPELLALLRGEG